MDTLRDSLLKFSTNDIVFIGGDFNSKIEIENDFITENEKDLNYLPQNYELDVQGIKILSQTKSSRIPRFVKIHLTSHHN